METNTIDILTTCPFCGKDNEVTVPFAEFNAYENGEVAQRAFKSLNATQRELIISGICPDCQKRIFYGED